jgi:hypothetical protein
MTHDSIGRSGKAASGRPVSMDKYYRGLFFFRIWNVKVPHDFKMARIKPNFFSEVDFLIGLPSEKKWLIQENQSAKKKKNAQYQSISFHINAPFYTFRIFIEVCIYFFYLNS